MNKIIALTPLVGLLALTFSPASRAQLAISDDFTQPVDTSAWKTFGGACLTAGTGSGTTSIPACVGLSYYAGQIQIGGNSGYLGQTTAPSSGSTQAPDPSGYGALRFTNGYNGNSGFAGGFEQSGAIISTSTFGAGAGVQIIFKTVTYHGDSGGSGKDGADGISFALLDGNYPIYDVGALGGSLGYSCSNSNNDTTLHPDGTPRGFDGIQHGYIGLGIDEFGNFLNAGDNTATGFGAVPNRIGLRGAGNINWAALNAAYSTYYPSSLSASTRTAAVQNTCRSGYLYNYSSGIGVQTATAVLDYPALYSTVGVGAYTVLTAFKIANESAATRSAATPIAYNLKITQNGLLSLSYSVGGTYIPIITNQSIANTNGPLPTSFRFGFSGSTGGDNNVHEILCFQATPSDLASSSVGINQKQASKLATGTQAYLAYYYPSTWTGRLTASNLDYNATTQTLTIDPVANWDASCNLTGIPSGSVCPSTGVAGTVAPQNPSTRTMLSWNGSQGVPFEWSTTLGSGTLSATQELTLDANDALPYNGNRLNYLRGVRTNEITSTGTGLFRARLGVLGDIIDSSPTWVGPPSSPYTAVWKDLLVSTDPITENSGQSFNSYLNPTTPRMNVVYTGANDGFLHGFRTGALDSNGNLVSTYPNDGFEVLAYMPSTVVQSIHNTVDYSQDFSNPLYSHNYYVDAPPDVDDLYYNGTWHAWLVGGLGPGGAAIYALDVTDPTQFTEANAKSVVLGEWTPLTISCVNAAGCGNNLGNTYGVPIIRRLHDGNWGVIFGNGYGSTTGDAGIFIMIVNGASGAISSTYYLSTHTGSSLNPNGIAYVAPADLDADHITDYVYAGDLLGNVWRFDLTSGTESAWAAAGTPLFTVPNALPITTKLLVTIVPQTNSLPRVMVDFGTGRKTAQTNTTSAALISTGVQQYVYGIWDWNMASWNAKSATDFASLTGTQTITASTLTAQTLTPMGGYPGTASAPAGYLDVSNNPVCWKGSTTCTTGNTQFGFQVALPGLNEQVIFNPLLYQNAFIINTTIPAVNSLTSCVVATDTGDTLSLSVSTGGSLATTGTGGTSKGFYTGIADPNAAGNLTNATGTGSIILAGGSAFLLTQSTGNGTQSTSPVTCPKGALYCSGQISQAGVSGKRLTWVERR